MAARSVQTPSGGVTSQRPSPRFASAPSKKLLTVKIALAPAGGGEPARAGEGEPMNRATLPRIRQIAAKVRRVGAHIILAFIP
jgi:hypothetical protein